MKHNNQNITKQKDDYQFIQQTVIPKKKHRLKNFIVIPILTILLAILFGFVARFAFIQSDPWLNKLLGKEEPKNMISFPSMDLLLHEDFPSVNKTDEDKEEKKADKEEKKPIIIENTVSANISDYISMYSQINKVAEFSNRSIVQVTSVENSVDWFNNSYEKKDMTSGLILAKESNMIYILVQNAKLQKANHIKVTFNSGFSKEADLIGYDTELNLAVITLPVEGVPDSVMSHLRIATLGESYMLSTGTPIIALGRPNGYMYSVELGMVTNKLQSVYITDNKLDLFYTDITNYENSDGVIINFEGEVVGLITHIFEGKDKISTAIAISRVKTIIEKLVNEQPQVYCGINGVDITVEAEETLGVANGVYVTEVLAKSPALEAGIQAGDVIIKVEEKPISSMASFYNTITDYHPKDIAKITVLRSTKAERKELILQVKLGKRK